MAPNEMTIHDLRQLRDKAIHDGANSGQDLIDWLRKKGINQMTDSNIKLFWETGDCKGLVKV